MLDINDVIKVLKDIQENIRAGNVGTVVDVFGVTFSVYLIEFATATLNFIKDRVLDNNKVNAYFLGSYGYK